MKVRSESEMLELGRRLAFDLSLPAVFELVGDVGTGKTTFTRGLAAGLGVTEPITSPSFTIAKRYYFTSASGQPGELVHYDFYRLPDPGIMSDELAETLSRPNTVVVVEWGEDVANLLPDHRFRLNLALTDDGSREVSIIPAHREPHQ